MNKEKKPLKKKSRKKQKKASIGKEYVIISYAFVTVFLSLIFYLVYFNVELRDTYANSPYNSKRQETYKEEVVKGSILSSAGEVLAETVQKEDGTEEREYPYGDVFAHVVGYSDRGISGLEQTMNSQLLTSNVNPTQQLQNGLNNTKSMGDSVITTLDTKLQQAAYDALGDRKGAIVVIEPDTGKILAMVSKPDFNPNTIAEDWESITEDETNSCLVNRATQGQYPPGSIFKIVTALAYWREHQNLDDFSYDCSGEVTNGGFTIHCYKNNAHGSEDFSTAFAKSCNSAFAQIGVDMDKDAFFALAEELLFNQDLPLDMQYRQSKFSMNQQTADALAMQTAIGQGETLVTPMYMAMLTSAIANDGQLMKPYLVEKIQSSDGRTVKTYSEKTYKNLMSSREAQVLTELMTGVVEHGTASKLFGRGYTVAGKTGTAEHGIVSETTPHSWFVGFSNVDDPDIAVCVLVEESGAGSEVAVPAAGKIFDAYYN